MRNYNNALSYYWQQQSSGFDNFSSSNLDISSIVDGNINSYFGAGYNNLINSEQIIDVASQFPYCLPAMHSSSMATPIENIGVNSPPQMLDYQWNLPYDTIKNDNNLFVQTCRPTIKDVRKSVNGARIGQRNSTIGNIASLEASRMSKKRKAIEQFIDARKLQSPGRRSQKLSDKINILQEIVSPYGKTDTASVLQEACIYIKIIHQEIRRLSISYFEGRSLQLQAHLQGDAERQCDLQSRGLCLVPVSIMKKLTRDSLVEPHQTAWRGIGRPAIL